MLIFSEFIILSLSSHNLEQSTLQAYTPDQLLAYVRAVSEVESFLLGEYVLHMNAGHAVLVGYALWQGDGAQYADKAGQATQLAAAVEFLQNMEGLETVTLLAPRLMACVPAHAIVREDAYYFLELPLSLSERKNAFYMCQRALKSVNIQQVCGENARQAHFWTGAHQELVLSYIQRPDVTKDMGAIFQRLERYCHEPHVCLFSAYDSVSNELQGFCVGDFSSWQTALYMFAFRTQDAVPGVADVLLWSLIEEARRRGYARCNLGLGIHDGIRFFKQKWGARATLPMFECTWKIGKEGQANTGKSWWLRLFVR